MSRVSLSLKSARLIDSWAEIQVDRIDVHTRAALAELRSQLRPKPRSSAVRKTEKRQKAKRNSFAKVRKAVAKRAGMTCECGCGRWFRGFGGAATTDHFWGVAREESVESCWRIRFDCHEDKGNGRPSRGWWLGRFIAHCRVHGYTAQVEKAEAELASMSEIDKAASLTWRGAK